MNNGRLSVILFIIFIISIVIIIRLIDIQIINKDKYVKLAELQQTDTDKIRPEPGLIYDRNNNLLVYNRNDVTFHLDLNIATEKEIKIIVDTFAKVIGKDRNHYLSKINNKKGTITLQKKVQPHQLEKLKELDYDCLYYVPDPTRVYHHGSLASHILGFVNSEHKFVSGVSEYFSKELEGIAGYRKVYKNAFGKIVSYDEKEMEPAIPGNNLYLTIDKRYQAILEEELRNGIHQYGAHSATGIIMNPNNGEILALSNIDDYDPNFYSKYTDFQRRNRAITDTYEPGSTFKAFTLAALLDRNLCYLNENIFTENGVYKFNKTTIRDVEKYSYLNVENVLINSSNIGMAKLAKRLKDDDYFKYLRSLGFGNLTSIQIKGETAGKLKKPTQWASTTKAFISFGYEVSVTPIQLITAFSALINGGILYQPQLIQKKVRHDGELIEEFQKKQIRRVISEETSSIMKTILGKAVKKGTGKQAAIEYISVGGKTGTSQKFIDGSYSKSHYNTSFIGFFPVEDPQVIILIHYNSPQTAKYGGFVAAPVFKSVAEKIIEKDFSKFEKYVDDEYKQKMLYSNSSGHNVSEKFVENTLSKNKSSLIMPNLINQPLSEAVSKLNRLGINYKIKGSGIITEQSIPAGEVVTENSLCLLECSPFQIIKTSRR